MAKFELADKRTLGNEGFYANNPHDKGGETWEGIARNYHSNWPGWAIIDQYKAQYHDVHSLNNALRQNQELASMVCDFYKKGFWDVSQLDRFSSQLLAENVFDAAVNCGAAMGPHFLQQCLNNLKPYGLTVDNVVGNMTFNAMGDALSCFGESEVVNKYVDTREAYHKTIVQRDPSQACFLPGWLSRCEGMRKEC